MPKVKAMDATEKVLARMFPSEKIEPVKYGTNLSPLTYSIYCPHCDEGNVVMDSQFGSYEDCRFCGERFAIPKQAKR